MAGTNGHYILAFVDRGGDSTTGFEKDAIVVGRLASCDLILDHKSVSRIHVGINFLDAEYFLINLSGRNIVSLNGRILKPQETDVLADGDIIQIGPFALTVRRYAEELYVSVQQLSAAEMLSTDRELRRAEVVQSRVKKEKVDVLKVFWKKRSREKEDWGSRLRPTAKPQPGKAVINWKPTSDLTRTWRAGVFIWTLIIIGAAAVFAYMRFPEAYAPKPLSNPHTTGIESSAIAVRPNGNSCTTCHVLNAPIVNSCISCHRAEQFHASNTKAHEEAGISCLSCHKEHQGADFSLTASAVQSCSQCHNDNNPNRYNRMTVHTPHSGSFGYPVENGIWKWKGVYREEAESIPEINGSATGDVDEQARLSRHFHSVHVGRLQIPQGLKGASNGLVSCSTCHNRFDPIDRETPKQTCAACHTANPNPRTDGSASVVRSVNCISCHVQHPYSQKRWSEFLSDDAAARRHNAVAAQIKNLSVE
jgi:pSer/pThr/pTyr-binding forkhead associated (FHA) protein